MEWDLSRTVAQNGRLGQLAIAAPRNPAARDDVAGQRLRLLDPDVGIGDEVLEPLDVVEGRDWLGFGGIAPPSFPVISREQQFAEKVHAYSLPRGDRVNTRTKDLIDMLLLIRQGKLDNPRLVAAIKATFTKRATHPMPWKLEPPPAEWEPVFQALARECDLDVRLSAGFETVQGFVGKIFGRPTG